MIKKRSIIFFAFVPLLAGYIFGVIETEKPVVKPSVSFSTTGVQQADVLTISDQGDIFTLSHGKQTQITQGQRVIQPAFLGRSFVAINKQQNYSELLQFSFGGIKTKTLLSGKTESIDSMSYISDPAVSPTFQDIAFVSDMDRVKTTISDTALYILNVSSGKIKKVADPLPHSGGITHPMWNPINPRVLVYDYYQYDENYAPYSLIMQYDMDSNKTISLTTKAQNAYQGAFSPDGKHFMFLSRSEDNTEVMINISEVTADGLSNVRSFARGDFAYPMFSQVQGYIYYLRAYGNHGYNLYTSFIKNNQLTNISQISTGEQLFAHSGLSVSKRQ